MQDGVEGVGISTSELVWLLEISKIYKLSHTQGEISMLKTSIQI